ncbi:hypothetical protein SDD30_11780 [Moorella naiadis]|uniref:hypothetical protein n=1 Tax=Moorella naiadis (nom. illeg.) TaxID=3093670 RepID=UPI003D9C972A
MLARLAERTLENITPWAWAVAGAAVLLSWQPARKGLRSLALAGVREGMVVSNRLNELKGNWRQAWHDLVAEAQNVARVTEDVKAAAANIERTAAEVKEFVADD